MPRFYRLRTTYAWLAFSICVIELLLGILVPWNSFLDPAGPPSDLLKEREPLPMGYIEKSIPAETTPSLGPDHERVGARLNESSSSHPPINSTTQKANSGPGQPINNKTALDLDSIIANLSRPWIFNATHKDRTRSKLNDLIAAADFAILTNQNTVPGKNITFALNKRLFQVVTKELFQMLPKVSPLSNLTSCSVVGNSGILANSHCGQAIDRKDFVFRCNTPPLKGYEDHAGTKSNLASINPFGVIGSKYKRLASVSYRNKFLKDMKLYGDLLIPAYGPNVYAYKISIQALRLLKQKGSSTRGLIINPDHFKALQSIWEGLGLKSRMTTGFYLASVALSVCDSVDLYGYWPFAEGLHHQPVAYHYYDKAKISKGVHNFNWEFDVLYQLHMSGVLRMQVGSCK